VKRARFAHWGCVTTCDATTTKAQQLTSIGAFPIVSTNTTTTTTPIPTPAPAAPLTPTPATATNVVTTCEGECPLLSTTLTAAQRSPCIWACLNADVTALTTLTAASAAAANATSSDAALLVAAQQAAGAVNVCVVACASDPEIEVC
jgi:hypothetical protein